MPAQRLEAINEFIKVVAIVGHVLAGVIAMLLHKGRHLRLLGPVYAFYERYAEFAIVDAPDLHAAVGVPGTGIVNALDEGASLDLYVKPSPPFDVARCDGVGHMIDFLEVRHGEGS